uniref:Lipoprotein n=1 Tax=Acinetobacter ursingii TaxID=108980 RepID=A0A499RSH1_9GAMM|nr:hypothetical protein [Acinetobacter ursingii]AXK00634.1 hypothetical protein [Acinetobacter ursingii]
MKNIKLVLSSAILLPLVGCSILPQPDEIRPNQMLKYQTPENIINSKNLNGKAGTGKDYMLTGYKEALLPHSYMNNLCKSQNGSLRQIQRSSYAYLDKRNNPSPKTIGSELAPHIGIFECNVSSPWYVSIEPLSSRYGGTNKNLDIISLKTKVIDRSSLKGHIDYYNVHRQEELEQDKRKYNERLRQENERQRQEQAQINAKNRFIAANAPTTKDIGKTICNETVLSAFTGIYVFGQPNFKQTNGTVIASVEGFSNDQKNIKINIKGFLNTQNGISAGSDVLYNQIPLEAGRTVWDSKANWFKCNY